MSAGEKEYRRKKVKAGAAREKRLEIVEAVRNGLDLPMAAAQCNVSLKDAAKATAWGAHVALHTKVRVDVADKVQDARHYSAEQLEPTLREIDDPYKKFKALHEVLVGTGDLRPESGNVFVANLVANCPVDWKEKILIESGAEK